MVSLKSLRVLQAVRIGQPFLKPHYGFYKSLKTFEYQMFFYNASLILCIKTSFLMEQKHYRFQKTIRNNISTFFVTFFVVNLRARSKLEIRTSDSTSDSPKRGVRFDSSETKIRNRETRLEAGDTVTSVVYRAAGVDRIDTNVSFLLYRRNRTID